MFPKIGATMAELTILLAAARNGDNLAASKAFSLLYDDLRRLARSRLRQHQQFTLLDTTALVHESYLKLVGVESLAIEDKKHFFTYASTVMRSVIVDFARARAADRRGGDADHVVLDTTLSEKLGMPEDDVVRVHEALEVLAKADAALAQIVEMRYFGGLTEPEIAEALGISERTVRRNWEKARLLLAGVLRD
jgi:RNA polymerase sigma factor (TIGR02999 family)